jgi:serine protease Do
MHRRDTLLTLALALLPAAAAAQPDPVADEAAIKAAVARVAPSVVQIETTGGTEVLSAGPGGVVRRGVGPTTGLVVGADGYVVSSAFNFANKPSGVFASVPGRKERFVAKVVATDQTRMLTLLKIEVTGLPVPAPAPKSGFRVGQWAVALGRTLDTVERPPSVSVGIVSALGRIWGKAVQTDAKVSPVNYGGPLVDIEGRVIGVLVPASPRAEGEAAGVEWYDSGIGFAIPLEDVLAVLPRLQQGKDLRRGLLGITPKSADMYSVAPAIGTVANDSAAAKAGLLPGDVITQIDGRAVVSHAQLLHVLGPKYEGDAVSVKVRRGDKELSFDKIVLAGAVSAFETPFLGILPVRDDPEPGVEVRHVIPTSPADKAGLKAGDRILKIAPASAMQQRPFKGRDDLLALMDQLSPGGEVKLVVKRKGGGKEETLTVRLAAMTGDAIPDKPAGPASKGKALAAAGAAKEAPAKKPETGLIERKNALGREYWAYVPENYDPNVAHGVVVWLHPTGRGTDPRDLVDLWLDACETKHLILVGPKAAGEAGWQASDLEFIQTAVKEATADYTIDAKRVVMHGMGVGGQMAFYTGFQDRELVRGVATVGAVLATQPKENQSGKRLAFFVVAGGKDPLAKQIAEVKPALAGKKFPVFFKEVAEIGREYMDFATLRELAAWVDALDRI